MIVADTNLVAYLLMEGPRTAAAEAVFVADAGWAAPLLWRSEFRNILVLKMRHHHLPVPDAHLLMQDAMDVIGEREFELDSAPVLDVAMEKGLTAYDAEYLLLARELRIPFVTTDEAILRAAPGEAVRPESFSSI